MAHHPHLQCDGAQRPVPDIPTGRVIPLSPLHVPPLVGRDPGGPGSQRHFTGPGRYIPPHMESHGTQPYMPLENPPFQYVPFQLVPPQHALSPYMSPQHAQSQYMPPQGAPSQYVPPQSALSQYAPPQGTPSQYVPPQGAPSQYAPPRHAPPQYVPSQHTPSQYAPPQHLPLQYAPPQHLPFQYPNVSVAHLPWGYTYLAPLPTPVPHQVIVRPGGQAPPAQGSSTPAVESPPARVEQKVVREEGEEGPAMTQTEPAHPGRRYPNPWISDGSKL